MTLFRLLSVLLVQTCWILSVSGSQDAAGPASTTAAPAPVSGPAVTTSDLRTSIGTSSNQTGEQRHMDDGLDGSMIQRALYVLIGVTMIGVLYFLIRAVRLKKPGLKKKKYGLLSNYDDSVEMDGGDSDEDDTLYEARSLRR